MQCKYLGIRQPTYYLNWKQKHGDQQWNLTLHSQLSIQRQCFLWSPNEVISTDFSNFQLIVKCILIRTKRGNIVIVTRKGEIRARKVEILLFSCVNISTFRFITFSTSRSVSLFQNLKKGINFQRKFYTIRM